MTDCGINPNYSVKFFRPGVYKVVKFKNGLRLHVPERRGEGESTPNAEKLSQSLTRAKSVVTQIAICNEWQYDDVLPYLPIALLGVIVLCLFMKRF